MMISSFYGYNVRTMRENATQIVAVASACSLMTDNFHDTVFEPIFQAVNRVSTLKPPRAKSIVLCYIFIVDSANALPRRRLEAQQK